MFNLKSLKSAISSGNKSVKIMASNNFLEAINEAKEKTDVLEKNNEEKYNKCFNEAMMCLNIFTATEGFDQETFSLAVDNLIEAATIKSGRAEPYFYLAWLFNFINDVNNAVKYLKFARVINPNLENLDVLSQEITRKQLETAKV